ncbi:hypothetical protein [Streptomyces sp. A5-4]|uniref:hypothetical protein n=1 Tax=Streptomyces sp. A5-4 TaxID=3384771 RepID=UPI003DA7AD28
MTVMISRRSRPMDCPAAAANARGAARTANYSMRQASASARQAVSFAVSAQTSASQAQASAIAAGKDAHAAAAAASEARSIAVAKRRAEIEALAKQAAAAAKQFEKDGVNPTDKPENDDDTTGDTQWAGMLPQDISDAKDWASAVGHWSTLAGGISVVAALVALIPWAAPVAAPVALWVGVGSWALQGASAALSGFGYGWDSKEFHTGLGLFALGGAFIGKSGMTRSMLRKVGVDEAMVGEKVSDLATGLTTTVIGWVTW